MLQEVSTSEKKNSPLKKNESLIIFCRKWIDDVCERAQVIVSSAIPGQVVIDEIKYFEQLMKIMLINNP